MKVQEYLNNNFSNKEVKTMDLSGWNEKEWKEKPNWEKLTGDLDLSEFPNLEKLDCSFNKITSLNLSNCPKLTELKCWENELREIKFPKKLKLKTFYSWTNYLTEIDWDAFDSSSLTHISVSNNNLQEQNISVFGKFINLKELYIGNDIPERISQNINNRFQGSTKSLKLLTKLKKLQIEGTAIYLQENVEIISWGKETIVRKLNLSKESAEELRWTNPDRFTKILNEVLIEHARKQRGLNLTLEQEKKIEELGTEIAFHAQPKTIELETKIQNLQVYWEKLLAEQEEDKQNKITSEVVPLERLFVIRSNIQQFLKKWGNEDKDGKTELSKLQSPEQFSSFKYLAGIEYASTATTVVGGALTLLDFSTTGGVITLTAPLVGSGVTQLKSVFYEDKKAKWVEFKTDADTFLDNYNELLGILKQVEAGKLGTINEALKDLKDKVNKFLEEYDEDGDEEIDIEELTKNRKKFNSELGKVEKIVKSMKYLENVVINYRQNKKIERKPTMIAPKQETTVPISGSFLTKIEKIVKEFTTQEKCLPCYLYERWKDKKVQENLSEEELIHKKSQSPELLAQQEIYPK
jgi:hypothetical protein